MAFVLYFNDVYIDMEPLTAFFVWTFIIGLIGFMILNHNKFQRRDRVLERKIKFQNRNKKQNKPWIEFPHPLIMLLGVILIAWLAAVVYGLGELFKNIGPFSFIVLVLWLTSVNTKS